MALNGNRLFHSLNGKPTFGYFFSLSSHRLRLPLYAIKGEARMSLNATTPPPKNNRRADLSARRLLFLLLFYQFLIFFLKKYCFCLRLSS